MMMKSYLVSLFLLASCAPLGSGFAPLASGRLSSRLSYSSPSDMSDEDYQRMMQQRQQQQDMMQQQQQQGFMSSPPPPHMMGMPPPPPHMMDMNGPPPHMMNNMPLNHMNMHPMHQQPEPFMPPLQQQQMMHEEQMMRMQQQQQQQSQPQQQNQQDSNNYSNDPVLQLDAMMDEISHVNPMENPQVRKQLEQKIEDTLMAAELGIRKAQLQFYEAITNQNLTTMSTLWSQTQPVANVNPEMPRIEGFANVMDNWKYIFEGNEFNIEAVYPEISFAGDTATCRCVEQINGGQGGKLQAVNVFKRENGAWKMTMHLTTPLVEERSFE